jgi:ATP phosphoribosyltransferase
MMKKSFTLALPSKGAISEPTDSFLREAGMKVSRPNPRQYTGNIANIPNLGVLFQRVKDVVYKVSDGTVELGITGLDVVYENMNDKLLIIHDKLNYGQCSLVIGVPEAWIDVESVADLVEVANDIREKQHRNLRVATTFPNLTRQFFHKNHIHHFTIVKAEGAIEAAPTIGYADMIVDLTASGTTLRENHLKQITGGTIIESQACLIGNRQKLLENPELREIVRQLVEYIDATLNGREYYQLMVDIEGKNPQEIASKISQNPSTKGLLGPTIAPIYSVKSSEKTWYTVTITVSNKNLLSAVEYLRSIGGIHVLISPIKYVFLEQSRTYAQLLKKLDLA